MKMEPVFSESGELLFPDLHDSRLTSVRAEGKDFHVELFDASKQKIVAVFRNVEEVLINDFRSTNIVLDFTIEQGSTVHRSDIERLFIKPSVASKEYAARIEAIQMRIKQGNLSYVVISPTLGCEAIILCQLVEFERGLL